MQVPPQAVENIPNKVLQVDTTNILFICGGAFAGLDKLIDSRGKGSSIGFGAKVKNFKDQPLSEIMKMLEPEDLPIWTRVYGRMLYGYAR